MHGFYYVYELIDPRDSKVFYVGKGCRNRIDQHEHEAKKGRQSRKCDVIREIQSNGLCVVKNIVKRFDDEMVAYQFEAERIASVGLANLTNVAPGGGSVRVYKVDPLAKDIEIVDACTKLIAVLNRNFPDLSFERLLSKPAQMLYEVSISRGLDWVNNIAWKHRVKVTVET